MNDNLMQLRNAFVKKKMKILIPLTVFEVLLLSFLTFVMIIAEDGIGGGLFLPGFLLILLGPIMIIAWVAILKVDPSLNALDPQMRQRVNEDIPTAPRYANAIICRDCLLIETNRVKAIPYVDVIFAFGQNIANTSRYGMVTMSTTSSIIVVDRKKKQHALNSRTKAFKGNAVFDTLDDRNVFAALQQRAPWSFFGYSPENENLYLKDFPRMVYEVDARKAQMLAGAM